MSLHASHAQEHQSTYDTAITDAQRQIGHAILVNGPVVRARGSQNVGMLEVVEVGEEHLVGEVIGLERDVLTIQVYEETSGLRPGAPVYGTGMPLSVELGPGLLQSIFDGIQRPLPVLELRSGTFIGGRASRQRRYTASRNGPSRRSCPPESRCRLGRFWARCRRPR
jgi:V/A-type H+-transporting ATPase subunit A